MSGQGASGEKRKILCRKLVILRRKVEKDMTVSITRSKASVFLAFALLLLCGNCTTVSQLTESAERYQSNHYEKSCKAWSREARIHKGLEVRLIVSATFKSEQFRRSYTEEYARAYRLTPEEKRNFLKDQLQSSKRWHEFVMAIFVPEKKWDDFSKTRSMWRLYLVNDENERVSPLEVRKVKRGDAVTSYFFPYIPPWKCTYVVRFPSRVPGTGSPIIKERTRDIKLIITSILGTAEMRWNLR
ncbi:MAG: hypothetical protein DRH15_00245 [Deltaproteobacteria bacterium]|nr:MAG: hypothetical protein DRH15_00245 [Deltaproteobacteria bacterium]